MVSKKQGVGGSDGSTITSLASPKKKCRKCAIGSRGTSGVNGGEVEVVEKAKVLKRGPWSTEEDGMLMKYVKSRGEKNWKNVQTTGLMRCGKSCRLRWTNHLRPDLKKGPFSFEEEKIVVQLHQKLGNRWSRIAAKLPGRTDNEVKNFWNTKIKRRLTPNSLEICEDNSSSSQQDEVIQTPSTLPPMNSPKSLLSPQNPHMNFNSSPTMPFPKNSTYQFNFFDESESRNNLSFAQNLPPISMLNVSQNPLLNNPIANPFAGSHFLDFGTSSAYYYPNPLPENQTGFESSIVLPSIQVPTTTTQTDVSSSIYNHHGFLGYLLGGEMWKDSLSFEPNIALTPSSVQKQGYNPENDGGVAPYVAGAENDGLSTFGSNYNYDGLSIFGSNYNYDGLSTFVNETDDSSIALEVAPKEELLLEDVMEPIDDELSSLLNTFSSDGSPPELHLTIGGENQLENMTSSCSHFYLDQPLYAFASFSGATDAAVSGSDSIASTLSDLDSYIDGEEWVDTPGSS